MKSISQRNFIVTASMIFAALVLVVLSMFGIGRAYILEEYRAGMSNSAREVARAASAISESESISSWNLKLTISSVSKATGNGILISDPDGNVMLCSDDLPICEHIGKNVGSAVISELASAGAYEGDTSLGDVLEEVKIVSAVPVGEDTGTVTGYVFIYVSEDSVFSTWRTFVTISLMVFSGIFVVILILSFWFSKNLSRPIDEIVEVSRKYARGDFKPRVEQTEDPTSEIGTLISAFNIMADSLESAEMRRSEFISNISHELRTPMTTISGFADGILDGTIPKEEEAKYLRSISDETRRLSRLVRNMLDVSKMNSMAADPARRTAFDLTELILQTLLSFESRATKKNLDVDPQLPSMHIMVRADKDGITQVVYNLLDNAVKFAEKGSCIIVNLLVQDGKAVVSVADRGETIAPDDLPFIFDRFHKSDRSRSIDKDGVGLGLYLVKSIINNHDEDIWVKSENGETVFTFTLPVEEGKKK